MSIVLIGDVHGKTQQYQKLLRQKYEGVRTVQIGDMGIGFKGAGLHKMPPNHLWLRGNHDDPEKCKQNVNYLGEYGFLPADNLFYLAGAFSIDRADRVPGVSWWSGEELSYNELQKAIDLYTEVKPRFVISHEAPANAGKYMLHALSWRDEDGYYTAKMACTGSRTAEALQVMQDAHAPEEWVFAHYHLNKHFEFQGTKFTCVAELSQYELHTEAA